MEMAQNSHPIGMLFLLAGKHVHERKGRWTNERVSRISCICNLSSGALWSLVDTVEQCKGTAGLDIPSVGCSCWGSALNEDVKVQECTATSGIAPFILSLGTRLTKWLTSRPGRFTPRKESAVPIEQEAGRSPESVWTFRRRYSYVSSLAGIRKPGSQARCLLTMATELSRFITGSDFDYVSTWLSRWNPSAQSPRYYFTSPNVKS